MAEPMEGLHLVTHLVHLVVLSLICCGNKCAGAVRAGRRQEGTQDCPMMSEEPHTWFCGVLKLNPCQMLYAS